jgi:hypothetical protein
MARYFTREEAEALLPLVSEIVLTMQGQKQQLDEAQAHLQTIAAKATGNGHVNGDQSRDLRPEIERLSDALNANLQRLNDLGVEMKGLDQGLLDFRALREGREIYLCWRLGEDHIAYWHEIDTGFAGRQPLPPDD